MSCNAPGVQRWDTTEIISNHEISEKLHNQGLESFVSNSDQFFELMKSDLLKFNRIIKSAGIKMEE